MTADGARTLDNVCAPLGQHTDTQIIVERVRKLEWAFVDGISRKFRFDLENSRTTSRVLILNMAPSGHIDFANNTPAQ